MLTLLHGSYQIKGSADLNFNLLILKSWLTLKFQASKYELDV